MGWGGRKGERVIGPSTSVPRVKRSRRWQRRARRTEIAAIGNCIIGAVVGITPSFQECIRDHKNDLYYYKGTRNAGVLVDTAARTFPFALRPKADNKDNTCANRCRHRHAFGPWWLRQSPPMGN